MKSTRWMMMTAVCVAALMAPAGIQAEQEVVDLEDFEAVTQGLFDGTYDLSLDDAGGDGIGNRIRPCTPGPNDDIEELMIPQVFFGGRQWIQQGPLIVVAADPKADAKAAEKTSAKSDEKTTAAEPPKAAPVDPHIVRLHMADGTIVSGKLSITDLAIDTKFGRLSVPITKLRYVKPGLESRPKQKEQVAVWIEKLGSDADGDRKAAAAELLKLGPSLRIELNKFAADENTRRAAEVRTLIEKLNEQADPEFANPGDQTTLDIVATTDFTITGKIVPQSLQLDSDFGTLTMAVADLVKADREFGDPGEESKTLVVNEQNFTHRTFKSTGLRVQKGDKVVVRASGQIQMSRWGPNSVASPEGATTTGWYQNGRIYNGALVYRIGNSGAILKAGASLTFTAGESGLLHFGIAMNPRFAVNDGNAYPGEFKVDVKVMKK